MKYVKKGNKASYNGYLLNIGEYEQYKRLLNWIDEYKDFIKELNIKE